MSGLSQRRVAEGFRFACILTGNKEAAFAALDAAVAEFATHPGADDPANAEALFWATLRRRCLGTSARCELAGELAALHAGPEPARSAVAMSALGCLDAATIAATLGLRPGRAEAATGAQRAAAASIAQPAADRIEALAERLDGHPGLARRLMRNPASLAVGLGIALAVGLGIWHFGVSPPGFPDEAVAVATAATRAQPGEFTPLDLKLSHVPDWFAMHGHDAFRLPDAFPEMEAVGARTFRHEGEPVAQVAAIVGEQRLFLLSFHTKPFGFRLPDSSWQLKQAGAFALAIRAVGESCLLVALEGSVAGLEGILGKPPAPPTATPDHG